MDFTELQKALMRYVAAANHEDAAVRLGQVGEAEDARKEMAKALTRIRTIIIAEYEDPA